ncbi:hypothetical protein JCM21900_001456 [Sporobolomyces salmonicolor]
MSTPPSSTDSAFRTASPPRGAPPVGLDSPATDSTRPSSRSPSRSRSSLARLASAASGPPSRSTSREPRGAVGLGNFARSESKAREQRSQAPPATDALGPGDGSPHRSPSRSRSRGRPAAPATEDGGFRPPSSSVSRTRAALQKVLDFVGPQPEVVEDARTWGAVGFGSHGKASTGVRDEEREERSTSRGRAADVAKDNEREGGSGRTESRARSLARSMFGRRGGSGSRPSE